MSYKVNYYSQKVINEIYMLKVKHIKCVWLIRLVLFSFFTDEKFFRLVLSTNL